MKLFIKKYKEILYIALFIGIDAFCLYQYTDTMNLMLPLAILLSILIAVVLDFLAYTASFFGAGQLLVIPRIGLSEIKTDKNKAIIITILAVISVLVFQAFLINLRYGHIITKNEELKTATEDYKNKLSDNIFQSNVDRDMYELIEKPEYAGNEIMDYLSIIVPTATTILSFIIGLVSAKNYNKFEIDLAEINKELLEKQRELDKWLGKADACIYSLQLAGEIKNLKQVILADISGEDKNVLGDFIIKLENNLKKEAVKFYENQLKELTAVLEKKAENIKLEISHGANNPNIILDIDLINDFNKLFDELGKPNNDIFRIVNKGG